MEHPPPYEVNRSGRRSAHPRRLAAHALCLAHHAIPSGELKAVEAVRRLASAAIGHAALSPAQALILATDDLLALPDLDTAAALLEQAAVVWLAGTESTPTARTHQEREGTIAIRDLQPGQRVGVTRIGPAFVVGRIERDGALTTITTADGQQLSFAASGWLIDRSKD